MPRTSFTTNATTQVSTVQHHHASDALLDAEWDELEQLGQLEPLAQLICERDRLAAALQACEQRYTKLIERSFGLICSHSLDGLILSMNRAAVAALGCQADEVIGRNIQEFMPPSARQRFGEYLSNVVRKPRHGGHLAILTRSGEQRIWQFRSDHFASGDGPAYVLMQAQDTTERLQAEIALYEGQMRLDVLNAISARMFSGTPLMDVIARAVDQLRSAFPHLRVTYTVVDWQGLATLCYAAEGAGQLEQPNSTLDLTIDPDYLFTLWMGELICVDDVAQEQRLAPLADQLLLQGVHALLGMPIRSSQTQIGLLALHARCAYAWNEHEVVILREIAKYLTIAIQNDCDQQERARAEVELAHRSAELKAATQLIQYLLVSTSSAQQATASFLANMSHELLRFMNGVIGMSNVLLELPLTVEQREYVEIIRGSGDELLALLNDILDLSKLESGVLELVQEPFDLRECVESVLDLLAPRALEKGIELVSLIEEQVPQVLVGDSARFRQILVHVVTNALTFTQDGEVSVTIGSQPAITSVAQPSLQLVQCAVSDTGIGIPADQLRQLFQRFSQLDSSGTRRAGGLGLGLALSKQLCELLGGTMWAESVVGEGTTMHFSFCAAPVESRARSYLQDYEPRLIGKRLLIVDDNATIRRGLKLQAERWGMIVYTIGSGAEALRWIDAGFIFDLGIVDMQMPGMGGLVLAEAIHQRSGQARIPLILLTPASQLAQALPPGQFVARLAKPIKLAQLYTALLDSASCLALPVEARPRTRLDPHFSKRLPLRILVADDSPINRKLALRTLERMGYQADCAENGLEVLAALERQRYDVIFMDVQMPEMDGLEAARRICSQWLPAQRPRIIALTANALPDHRELCLAAGMDDYMSKPFHFDDLIAALERCAPGAARGLAAAATDVLQ